MSTRKSFRLFFWSAMALAFMVSPVFALRIAIISLSPAQAALKADVIITGKVVDIEKQTVDAVPFPNAPNKITYQIGLIRIDASIHGIKDLTQVRVGWQTGEPAPKLDPQLRIPIRGTPPVVTLEAGQEGCFFLKKHPTEDFYILLQNSRPVDKKAENFDKILASIKTVRSTLEKPIAALKAEKEAERHFAASVLIQYYAEYPVVTDPQKQPRQEPIGEEESRLILKAVLELPWENPADPTVSLSALLGYLNITPQEGWKQPAFDGKGDFGQLMKATFTAWYKEHGQKFRVKKWVAAK